MGSAVSIRDQLTDLRAQAIELRKTAQAMIDHIDQLGQQPLYTLENGLSVETVAREVARFAGLPYAEIIGKTRMRKIVEIRWTAYFFCFHLTGESGNSIAAKLNCANHTSFYYGYWALIDLWKAYPEFRARHQKIQDHLCQVFGFLLRITPDDSGPIRRFERIA